MRMGAQVALVEVKSEQANNLVQKDLLGFTNRPAKQSRRIWSLLFSLDTAMRTGSGATFALQISLPHVHFFSPAHV
jgi:hypothetical protein